MTCFFPLFLPTDDEHAADASFYATEVQAYKKPGQGTAYRFVLPMALLW